MARGECSCVVQACLSEHAFERPSSSQVLDQLRATSSEHRRSLELPQLQLCPSTPQQQTKPAQEASQKNILLPLQSFPVIQAFIGGAAASAVQPSNLLLEDVGQQEQQRPVSPALPLCQDACEAPVRRLHASRSFSLAANDVLRGGAACMSGMRGSRASTQMLTSPRLCSNVADGSSTSRAGLSGVWSSVCASDAQRGASEVVCSSAVIGDGCRPMPHTTSVRFGLASVMRPLSAQSSSVSGWLSEGSTSMSFASHGTAY